MRAHWILPNREQRDEILASDGDTTMPLRRVLDPKVWPAGFSHGVPTELLEKCDSKNLAEILFAQRFPNWDGDKELFCVSTPAGLDASGRVVHIGLVFVLESGERPRFDLSCAGLSKEDAAYAKALNERMTSAKHADAWAESVRDLIELPRDVGPATNIALDRSVAPFESLYVLSHGQPVKKAERRSKSRRIALIVSLIFLVIVAGGGVVTWHFN